MPVGSTTALIIRTMRFYGIPFRMYLIDRGTFGLHLDVVIHAQNMPQLVGLFTMEDLRLIANNLEEEEKAIYEAFRSEIGVLPDPNPQYDRRRQLGHIVQWINQHDAFESGEIYLTSARTDETIKQTRPFTEFLRRLNGFESDRTLREYVPTHHREKPVSARGPRSHPVNYDRLRLKRRHDRRSTITKNLRARRDVSQPAATAPCSPRTDARAVAAPAAQDWTHDGHKTWL